MLRRVISLGGMGSFWSGIWEGRRPGEEGTGGSTHYLQGTVPIIVRLIQVSPSLPPCPQAFAVHP